LSVDPIPPPEAVESPRGMETERSEPEVDMGASIPFQRSVVFQRVLFLVMLKLLHSSYAAIP
jgi:hypothetical protein